MGTLPLDYTNSSIQESHPYRNTVTLITIVDISMMNEYMNKQKKATWMFSTPHSSPPPQKKNASLELKPTFLLAFSGQ